MATESTVKAPLDPLVGQETGREGVLSEYAGPYVTEMLGRGRALAEQPYEAYMGPLTAGESDLQSTAFQGLANLTIPTDAMGAYTPQTFTAENAQTYMNPYLQAALQPQIDEARRQAMIQLLQDQGRLTQAGAYGGARSALVGAESSRNLLQNLAGITGEGYRDAYNTAMGQFNTEQDRAMKAQDAANLYGLAAITKQADLGATQRDIEQQGITADRMQFEEERDFPYKQVQYMQSLLQNLPIAAQSYSYAEPSMLSNVLGGAGGIMNLFGEAFGMGKE